MRSFSELSPCFLRCFGLLPSLKRLQRNTQLKYWFTEKRGSPIYPKNRLVFESKTKGGKIRAFSYFNLSIEKDQKLAYGFADRRFFGFLSYTMKILTHRERRDHQSIPSLTWAPPFSEVQKSPKFSPGGQKVHSLNYWAHLEGRKSIH